MAARIHPHEPDNLKEAGLTLGFLNDLILRTLYTRGGLLGRHLVGLVVPVALLSVVVTVASGTAVLLSLDGQALIINDELHLDRPRRGEPSSSRS